MAYGSRTQLIVIPHDIQDCPLKNGGLYPPLSHKYLQGTSLVNDINLYIDISTLNIQNHIYCAKHR